jgi:beta-galactosidase
MWSTGNEIPNRGKDEVAAVAQMLTHFIKSLDTTRPVTAGVNGIDQKPDAFLAALDVAGYNYAWQVTKVIISECQTGLCMGLSHMH